MRSTFCSIFLLALSTIQVISAQSASESQLYPDSCTNVFLESPSKLLRERRERPFRDPQTGELNLEQKRAARAEWKQRLNQKGQVLTTDLHFENRGPYNRTGRIQKLLFDLGDPSGKKVWAGAHSGGLWVNNDISDPNVAWLRVEAFDDFAIQSIAADPSDPENIFVSVGRIFYKTTDGGATWAEITPTAANPGSVDAYQITAKNWAFGDFVVVNSTEMYAATGYGVIKSTDGGNTWARVLLPQAPTNWPVANQAPIGGTFTSTQAGAYANVTCLRRATDGAIFAAFGCGQLFKTTDGGQSWSNISPASIPNNGGMALIEPAPSTSGSSQVLYAVNGNPTFSQSWFMKSTDAGLTWTPRSWTTGWTQFYDNIVLEAHPSDANIVFYGTTSIVKSIDGASTITSIGSLSNAPVGQADFHDLHFAPNDPSNAILANDQGITYWTNINTPQSAGSVRYKGLVALQAIDAAQRNIAGDLMLVANPKDMPAQLMNSTGPANASSLNNNEGSWTAFDRDDPNLLMYCAFPASTLRIRNMTSGVEKNIPTFGQFSLSPRDYDSQNNRAIAYKGIDPNVPGRVRFDVVSNVSTVLNAANNVASVITIDGLFATNGASFTDFWGVRAVNFGKDPNTLFVLGWVDPIGKTALYKITNAFSGNPVVTLINQGQTWNFPCNTIAVGATDNELFVAGEIASTTENLFYTNDGGTTWKTMKNIVVQNGQYTTTSGLPVLFGAWWSIFNPNNPNQLFMSSFLGPVVCNDVTAAVPLWEPAATNILSTDCMKMDIRPADGQILVATFGRGVFTANLNACNDPAPIITAQPTNQNALPGGFAAFSFSATGATVYQWEVSSDNGNTWSDISVVNTIFTGQQTNILSIQAASSAEHGLNFRCRISNGCAVTYTSLAYLSVTCPPQAPTIVQSPPATISVTEGGSVTLSVVATNAVDYDWRYLYSNVWVHISPANPAYTGQNTPTLQIPAATLAQNGLNIRCRVIGCVQNTTVAPTILTVCPATSLTIQPQDQLNITQGNTAQFTVAASYNDALYSWEMQDPAPGSPWQTVPTTAPFIGQNSPQLQVSNVQSAQNETRFRCRISDYCQSTLLSNEAQLTLAGTTGADTPSAPALVAISPNPASETLLVMVPNSHFKIVVTDAKGAQTGSFANQNILDVKNWPAGVYTLAVSWEQGFWVEKIVISH